MQFEKKLTELEKLVEKLEDKNTTLQEGLELFEKGLCLTKDCLADLDKSKGRIETIKVEFNKLTEKELNCK